MTQQLMTTEDDDGFNGGLSNNRLIRGMLLRWNETHGWLDRDGLRPPDILLGFAINDALQQWKNKVADTITTKPLPDPKELNDKIPQSEWELGLNGLPKPPWEHVVVVYLVDPATGAFYTYLNSTAGAHIAVEQLREMVIAMRALRGARVVPVLKLGWRPMKTKVGMKRRPHFEPIDWKLVGGGGGGDEVAAQPRPRLSGPSTTAAVPPAPASQTAPYAGAQTLAGMQSVKPITPSEFVGDEVVF